MRIAIAMNNSYTARAIRCNMLSMLMHEGCDVVL